MADKKPVEINQFLNVQYQIKNQVKLFVGERSKTTFDSGCKMFDIYITDTFQVFKICK